MSQRPLDEIDEHILYALQQDARHTTTTELAEELEVSPSTVQNRIGQLEADGIVTGYRATVDWERAGFPFQVLMVATAPVGEREAIVQQAREIPGALNVRELMLGEDNVRVEVVGRSHDDLIEVATQLSDIGLQLHTELLIRNEFIQPVDPREGTRNR